MFGLFKNFKKSNNKRNNLKKGDSGIEYLTVVLVLNSPTTVAVVDEAIIEILKPWERTTFVKWKKD